MARVQTHVTCVDSHGRAMDVGAVGKAGVHAAAFADIKPVVRHEPTRAWPCPTAPAMGYGEGGKANQPYHPPPHHHRTQHQTSHYPYRENQSMDTRQAHGELGHTVTRLHPEWCPVLGRSVPQPHHPKYCCDQYASHQHSNAVPPLNFEVSCQDSMDSFNKGNVSQANWSQLNDRSPYVKSHGKRMDGKKRQHGNCSTQDIVPAQLRKQEQDFKDNPSRFRAYDYNHKGYPIRPGQQQCKHFRGKGWCRYASSEVSSEVCKFSHDDRQFQVHSQEKNFGQPAHPGPNVCPHPQAGTYMGSVPLPGCYWNGQNFTQVWFLPGLNWYQQQGMIDQRWPADSKVSSIRSALHFEDDRASNEGGVVDSIKSYGY